MNEDRVRAKVNHRDGDPGAESPSRVVPTIVFVAGIALSRTELLQ